MRGALQLLILLLVHYCDYYDDGTIRTNLRKDGQRGGMVVEKCKFLQVSYEIVPLSMHYYSMLLTAVLRM